MKVVLLHNGNLNPSIPIAYAVDMRENYENMEMLLRKIDYLKYQWQICADLKVVGILCGLKGGYAKHQCFLCNWEGRQTSLHYTDHKWKTRLAITVGKESIINLPLVDTTKIILPPLHIKLGLVKNFIRALKSDSDSISILQKIFPKLSEAKLNAGEEKNSYVYVKFQFLEILHSLI